MNRIEISTGTKNLSMNEIGIDRKIKIQDKRYAFYVYASEAAMAVTRRRHLHPELAASNEGVKAVSLDVTVASCQEVFNRTHPVRPGAWTAHNGFLSSFPIVAPTDYRFIYNPKKWREINKSPRICSTTGKTKAYLKVVSRVYSQVKRRLTCKPIDMGINDASAEWPPINVNTFQGGGARRCLGAANFRTPCSSRTMSASFLVAIIELTCPLSQEVPSREGLSLSRRERQRAGPSAEEGMNELDTKSGATLPHLRAAVGH
ncbi:hypothetical protein EVAR_59872_1 [Eumeta japonica]|uniref:Uncharacterized protein n=1 Tax=Eumeta variegata TaxID=151549 RepID=A0A4C1XLD8_EUMVA|nr:hypothetical protein EVAR_59872_1 [Eumeta japonica]